MEWRRGKVNNQALTKVFAVCSCLFILSGCVYNDEPMPGIAHEYPDFVPPVPFPPAKTRTNLKGTSNGNRAIFDKWHREGRHWAGVGYDFVIGNGTNSGDGQVETTYRWRRQETGAHCGGTPGNWANKDAIGICLVGDFNITAPTGRQMQSLVRLLRFLQRRYGISKSRIFGHGSTPGYTGKTKCPGKRFPMARLKSTLDF
jgi:hypothetical protein